MRQFLLVSSFVLSLQALAFSANRIDVATPTELAAAREAVKAFYAADPEPGPVDIVLAPGIYRLTPDTRIARGKDDPGTERSPVRYVSRDAENPAVITAAKEIPAGDFIAIETNGVAMLVADLSSGYLPPRSDGSALVPTYTSITNTWYMPARLPAVFVDDEPYVTANWPNDSQWAYFGHSDIREKSRLVATGATGKTGTFSFLNPTNEMYGVRRPDRWVNEPYVWLHGYFNWDYEDGMSAVTINTDDSRWPEKNPHDLTFTFLKEPVGGLGAGTQAQLHRWHAVHLFSELDVPGEYYFDLDSYKLYLIPTKTFTDATRIEITCEPDRLILLNRAQNVVFENLVLTKAVTAVAGANNTNIVFRNVRFEHIRTDANEKAAMNLSGSARVSVEGCLFSDIGGAGVFLKSTGDHKNLIPTSNRVADCTFEKCSRLVRTAAPGIAVSGIGDIVEHNLVCDFPHHAIGGGGANDAVFRYNIVSNCCFEGDDAAAFYKGKNPTSCGNILERNLWVDCGRNGPVGTMAIYFDDGDCGDTVRDNFFLRCGNQPRPGVDYTCGALNIGGGYAFTLKRNVFMDCYAGGRTNPGPSKDNVATNEAWWAEHVRAAYFDEIFARTDFEHNELFHTRYPWTAHFFDPPPESQRTNFFDNCTFINVDHPVFGREECLDNCRYLEEDDGTRPFLLHRAGPRPLAQRLDPSLAGPEITYYIAPSDTTLDAQDAEGYGLSPEKPFRTLAYAQVLVNAEVTTVEDAVAFVLLAGTHRVTEDLTFDGGYVILRGETDDPSATVLDFGGVGGRSLGLVDARLYSLTVKGAVSTSTDAAVCVTHEKDSFAFVSNCVFRANAGGAPLSVSDVPLSACVFDDSAEPLSSAFIRYSVSGAMVLGDGADHQLSVTVDFPENATVSYSTTGEGAWSSVAPCYSEIGTYSVWYKIEAPGFETLAAQVEMSIVAYGGVDLTALARERGTVSRPCATYASSATHVQGGVPNGTAATLFDGVVHSVGGSNESDRWLGASGEPAWATCAFTDAFFPGEEIFVSLFEIDIYKNAAEAYGPRRPKGWAFSGSNDGTSWTEIDSGTFAAEDWEEKVLDGSVCYVLRHALPAANRASFRHYRLDFEANEGNYLLLHELRLWGDIGCVASAVIDDLSYEYDGRERVPTVLSQYPESGTIFYSLSETGPWSEMPPTFTASGLFGTRTLYYRVQAEGCLTTAGRLTVSVALPDAEAEGLADLDITRLLREKDTPEFPTWSVVGVPYADGKDCNPTNYTASCAFNGNLGLSTRMDDRWMRKAEGGYLLDADHPLSAIYSIAPDWRPLYQPIVSRYEIDQLAYGSNTSTGIGTRPVREWKLYGRNLESEPWVLIDHRQDISWTKDNSTLSSDGNYYTQSFSIATPKVYRQYRFDQIAGNDDMTGGKATSLSEIRFFGSFNRRIARGLVFSVR